MKYFLLGDFLDNFGTSVSLTWDININLKNRVLNGFLDNIYNSVIENSALGVTLLCAWDLQQSYTKVN